MASSFKLVIDTYLDSTSEWSNILDIIFNVLFTLESLAKIISFGFIFDKNSYLRESWSRLDFFIVVSSLIDMSS